MKLLPTLFLLLLFSCINTLNAQQPQDSTQLENLRTQSGVDPTRVVTKLVYSIWYYDRSENRTQINNRLNFTIGVDRWSFGLKPEIVTINSGLPNEGFKTNFGDLRFSLLNAFYVKNKHALAAAAEFTVPTGDFGFGSQYFSVNPSITYSYTVNSSLFFAIQPQYLFHLSKAVDYPSLNVLTVRTFLAKFMASGWFFVFEPRISNDFGNNRFDFVIAPILGKSLGGGFNITSVAEFPTKRETIENRGILIQFGITKNF